MTNQPYSAQAGGVPAAAPPKDVQLAFQLWLAYIVLGVLGSLLAFLIADELIAIGVSQARADLPPEALEQVEAVAYAGFIVGLVLFLIIAALGVLFAIKMRAGRNWARITLTVLGAIGVLSSLFSFGDSAALAGIGLIGVLSMVISVIQILLIIAAIVFMFRPAAAQYFSAPRY